ncbi:protein amnionless isoform X2 [Heterodontus francisci]|uniref:protein amnionless isoform X2 n=1 Tax=Heterodontus francisci TaxID=7792 RepID=UPI00355BD3D1
MRSAHFISFGLFFHVSAALYRQWIPDTNFNNVTNWDKGRIPCKNDRVQFPKDKYMPLDGEFILSHGAGFAASDGQSEPGCERGEDITFKDPDQYKWYDPKYWHTALSMSDLENEKYQFTIDEESVPCQCDDIIFRPETSFRVDLDSDIQNINVKTITIMNWKFASSEEFTEYKCSNTGKLQFHGNGSLTVTNTKCEDKSGCECGNSGNHRRICSNLQQESGSHCPELVCTNPLKPQGHCCKICGAIIYLEYGLKFDLESYRAQLIHSFLGLKKYKGVKMSMTKVYKKLSSKQTIPNDAVPRIQIMLIDNETESATGTLAAALAYEIMEDITSRGDILGITNAELKESTKGEGEEGGNISAGEITGIVAGVFITALLIGSLIFLIISGRIRAKIPSALISFRKYDHFDTEETIDTFSNPMFDSSLNLSPDSYGLYSGENAITVIATRDASNFVTPYYVHASGEKDC